MKIHTSQLDSFVKKANQLQGGLNDPQMVKDYPMQLEFETYIDQNLCPFSDQYFDQQVLLYEEISGRKLDQSSGELHPVDISTLYEAANPLGIQDTTHVAEHIRAVSSMLSIASLGHDAQVLDMGAGHGLSSEILALAGCDVHAVDIDPVLSELASHRALKKNLRIRRYVANFDDLCRLPSGFDAAFFFQSLHHSLKPWELIANLKSKIKDGGIIAFTGEPIQTDWWRNWGLRLDHESLYVAREYGWFESGWSREFISKCFSRNGMKLHIFSGGHGGGDIGIATIAEGGAIVDRAIDLGYKLISNSLKYLSQIGKPCSVNDKAGYSGTGSGWLIYGPYISLEPGEYSINFDLIGSGSVDFDVVAEKGMVSFLKESFTVSQRVSRILLLSAHTDLVEIRLNINGTWVATNPEIVQLR